MEAIDVKQFVRRYFKAHNCTVHEKENGRLDIELNEEVDKKLMNRPFYWHYMKSMNQKGVPQTLQFGINQMTQKNGVEPIHFGSLRFQQLVDDLTRTKQIVHGFERVDTDVQTALYPWLIMNIKISYIGMQSKDEIFSLGLQLISGKIVVHMMEKLQEVPIESTISPMCYVLSPMITHVSGSKRIERILDTYLEEQDHEWAIHSMDALEEELQLIHTFYEEETADQLNEIEMVRKRYKPRIVFNVISGGVVYLKLDL